MAEVLEAPWAETMMEAESPPVFRLECGSGCHPLPANRCRPILGQAIRDAIQVALTAATKLEASPVDAETARKFQFFFGQPPTRPVPWANNRPSGLVVAQRYRAVARALREPGIFRCGCPGAPATANAATRPNGDILLCTSFWAEPKQFIRAGIVLHEAFHRYFWSFMSHRQGARDPIERRRDNAHCYEAFALRAADHGVDLSDVRGCRRRDP